MTTLQTLIICATPRTGSTLLCALLKSAGTAGRPESWYRAEDRDEYADDWRLPRDFNGQIDPAAYLAAAIRAGQSPNGTCGLRIQSRTLTGLLAELRTLFPAAAHDRALLEHAFGPCHFIFMRRLDEVAQAISRLKAEVSQIWHHDGRATPDQPPQASYDADRLDTFRAETAAGNAQWERWFTAESITPIRLVYETFITAPEAQVRAILTMLNLPPINPITAPNRRMADATSADWATRYRTERGLTT